MTSPLSKVLVNNVPMSIGDANVLTRELDILYGRGRQDVIFRNGSVTLDPVSGLLIINPSNGKPTVQLKSDGSSFFGSDLDEPGSTALSIFSTAQTYNSEDVGAGDLMMGDNSTGKANLYWDVSTGRLNFRGGTTVNTYIDTDGTITAIGGTFTGEITATSGTIGGWTIGSTVLSSGDIVLDGGNNKITVGAADNVVLDDDDGVSILATTIGGEDINQLKFMYQGTTKMAAVDAYRSGATEHIFTIETFIEDSREVTLLLKSQGDTRIQGYWEGGSDFKISDFDSITLENPTTVNALLTASVDGVTGGIVIGSDTQLYRSAANELYTPDRFQVGGQAEAETLKTTSDTGLYIGADCQLRRGGSNLLRTPDSLQVDGTFWVGSTADTALVRGGANHLRTGPGDYFNVYAGLRVGDATKGTDDDIRAVGDIVAGGGIRTGDVAADITDGKVYASTDLQAAGDVYRTVWTDYSASAGVVGWSAYTTKKIWYKRVGKMVFVKFYIVGTSNSSSAYFNVPSTADAGIPIHFQFQGQNNTGTYGTGSGVLAASAVRVNLYRTAAGASWTGSGTKGCFGQFFYEMN